MRLEIEKNDLDFGFTPIENMFINTYLAIANSDQIKVYLYGLSHAFSNKVENISNEIIAKEMKLSVGQVIDAWKFWIDEGLVENVNDKYIFKSLRYGYINQMLGNVGEDSKVFKQDDSGVAELPKESKETKELIENIEEFIAIGADVKIKLNPLEIEKVLKYMNEFKVSPGFISYAFPLASFERNTKSVHQVMETIRNWMIDGVLSEDSLTEYLDNKSRKKVESAVIPKKKKSKSTIGKDERMSAQERRKFIENRLNSDISFKPTED